MILHSLSKRALFLAVLLLSLAMPTLAQVQSGNIYGTVVSGGDKSPLPGVTVTLTGAGAPQVQATDAQGKFRFLGLVAGQLRRQGGDRRLLADRADRRLRQHRPQHQRGDQLQPAIQGDTVNVVADRSPLLDPHKQGPGQTVTLADLEKTPTRARSLGGAAVRRPAW